MKRLLLAGAAALALTLGASACASVDPDAAVVNGVHTKARDLEQLVADLHTAGAKTDATGNGALPSSEVRSLLETLIVTDVIHGEFLKRGLTADSAAAATTAPQLLSLDDATFGKLPQATQADWSRRAGEFLALRASLAGPEPSEADQQAFFDQNADAIKTQFGATATLADVRTQVVQAMQGDAANAALRGIIGDAAVTVNPRYGKWDPATGLGSIAPVLTER